MLVHHGERGYQEAASDAAAHAREKLGNLIERGSARALAVIDQVEREVPIDRLVPARWVRLEPTEKKGVALWANGDRHAVQDFALGQMCEKSGLPVGFGRDLAGAGDWQRELLAENLTTLLQHQDRKRFLVRLVERKAADEWTQDVRGFLSDRFRRLDCRPIVEAFCQAVGSIGAVPVEGYALDTRIAIKALLPKVYEPVPNEVMAFGVMLSNSDFGDGALSLRAFMLRLWCTNFAIGDESLRQVHLGGALPENIEFSAQTLELDTARSVSMLRDVVGGTLGPESVDRACTLVKRANDEGMEGRAVSAWLAKRLGKQDAAEVTAAFAGADIVNLPPGQTKWRLSNSLSWVAGQRQDSTAKLDLMRLAGEAAE